MWKRFTYSTVVVTQYEPKVGSFYSIDQANRAVNDVLTSNKSRVSDVANGRTAAVTLSKQFSYPTGREASVSNDDGKVLLRTTYDVKFRIEHDTRQAEGYSIRTAYPWHRDDTNSLIVGNEDDED